MRQTGLMGAPALGLHKGHMGYVARDLKSQNRQKQTVGERVIRTYEAELLVASYHGCCSASPCKRVGKGFGAMAWLPLRSELDGEGPWGPPSMQRTASRDQET